jgi:hypothetical protein
VGVEGAPVRWVSAAAIVVRGPGSGAVRGLRRVGHQGWGPRVAMKSIRPGCGRWAPASVDGVQLGGLGGVDGGVAVGGRHVWRGDEKIFEVSAWGRHDIELEKEGAISES